ncbi:MAG: AHH domain-containing protein [Novosphingobium sp.]
MNQGVLLAGLEEIAHPAAGLSLHNQRKLPALSFRAVNQRGKPGFDPGLQRHHILPLQLLAKNCFGAFVTALGRSRIGFDDFRSNGLLLPASHRAAITMALPMHRGPHRSYNAMVIERVGQIEERWAACRGDDPDQAGVEALFRLQLLQQALRRRLLDPRGKPMALNRRDPGRRGVDTRQLELDLFPKAESVGQFAEIDAMAELLWAESEPVAV